MSNINLLEIYNDGEVKKSTVIEPVLKKLRLKRLAPAPNPGEIQLIVITVNANLGCELNLDLIARKLQKEDPILDVKYETAMMAPTKLKKKAKIQKKKKDGSDKMRADFSNQCTVIIRLKHQIGPNDVPVPIYSTGESPANDYLDANLKIFRNGKIVVTGTTNITETADAINIFKNRIKSLTADYQVVPNLLITSLFPNVESYIKYAGKNYVVFLKLFELFGIKINLHLDVILNKKIYTKYLTHDENGKTIVTNLLDKSFEEIVHLQVLFKGDPPEIDKYARLIQAYNICHLYYNDSDLESKLNDSTDPVHQLILNLYNYQVMTLPVTFKLQQLEETTDSLLSINNHNTIFFCMYMLDRELLTKIMDADYKPHIISTVKYDPCKYQGVNAKYISRIHCTPDCKSKAPKKNPKCPCKRISFLIFQEGNVIVTGARTWEQVVDGYNVISKILMDVYHQVRVRSDNSTASLREDQLPPQIIHQPESGDQHVYLNIKQQLLNNPRNYFLLKTYGLLRRYLPAPSLSLQIPLIPD